MPTSAAAAAWSTLAKVLSPRAVIPPRKRSTVAAKSDEPRLVTIIAIPRCLVCGRSLQFRLPLRATTGRARPRYSIDSERKRAQLVRHPRALPGPREGRRQLNPPRHCSSPNITGLLASLSLRLQVMDPDAREQGWRLMSSC